MNNRTTPYLTRFSNLSQQKTSTMCVYECVCVSVYRTQPQPASLHPSRLQHMPISFIYGQRSRTAEAGELSCENSIILARFAYNLKQEIKNAFCFDNLPKHFTSALRQQSFCDIFTKLKCKLRWKKTSLIFISLSIVQSKTVVLKYHIAFNPKLIIVFYN